MPMIQITRNTIVNKKEALVDAVLEVEKKEARLLVSMKKARFIDMDEAVAAMGEALKLTDIIPPNEDEKKKK